MGNVQPIQPSHEQQPSRPFAPWNRRCISTNLLSPVYQKTSILQNLILLQDWQRVLCRVKLYPDELKQYMKFQVNSTSTLKVLPLHLACALDPPVAVVDQFLELYVDAAALALKPSKKFKQPFYSVEIKRSLKPNKNRKWKARIKKRYREWTKLRKGSFPDDENVEGFEDAQQSLLDPPSVFVTAPSRQSAIKLSWTDDDNSLQSSISSRPKSLPEKNIILQLSPTGNLNPTPIESGMTDETSETTVFRVHWDLDPLFQHVLNTGSLLALHIACFYSASGAILQSLTDAYPAAALCDIVGMLPIHWVAAGWTLPPILPRPASPITATQITGPVEALHVLKRTVPDSVRVKSGNHGMTPGEYIQECMEDCDAKDACLRIVDVDSDDSSDGGSIIFDSDETVSTSPSIKPESVVLMGQLVKSQDWEGLLAAVEDRPMIAKQWIYGMDEQIIAVWKRLPIHIVCAHAAPVGLVSVLLQAYPEGALAVDPRDSSTPLHISCASKAPVAVVKLLVSQCPESTTATNKQGRLPLHVAILNVASYSVIEALIQDHPNTVIALDDDKKSAIDYAKVIYGEHHIVYELVSMVKTILDNQEQAK